MLKLFVSVVIFMHGLIHLSGFAKSFGMVRQDAMSRPIGRMEGIIWLIAGGLFMISSILYYQKNNSWWLYSIIALLLSQYLIIVNWSDAKFGIVIHVFILLITITGFSKWNFHKQFVKDVKSEFRPDQPALLIPEDIAHLPMLLQNYLKVTNCIGKPKVKSFMVNFTGQIRSGADDEWMPFNSIQYNFINETARYFYLEATKKFLPVAGYHRFKKEASMDIRLFSLARIHYQTGREMDISETVTFFNDMCCMAPASLIDKRITWKQVSDQKVKATFTSNDITISADLIFNKEGRLINFISEDRYAVQPDGTMKKQRWSTPIGVYSEIGGYTIGTSADAIYTGNNEEFCYGQFKINGLEINPARLSDN